MITQPEQLQLFKKISQHLREPLTCYAFGGTAMMFYGYKEETKDIDLLFLSIEDRATFINVLKEIGFHISSPFRVYIERKQNDPKVPIMMRQYDYRIDLFAETIFRSRLSPGMRDSVRAVHEFGNNPRLRVYLLNTEQIVYLKGITERQRDFDDIRLIIKLDKNFSWQKVVDEALWQHEHADDWALIDTEKTLQEMRAYQDIDPKLLKQLHDAQRLGAKDVSQNKK